MYDKIKAIYDSYIQETKGNNNASNVQEKVQRVLRPQKQALDWQECV